MHTLVQDLSYGARMLLDHSCRTATATALFAALWLTATTAFAQPPRLWGKLQPGRYAVGLRVQPFAVPAGRRLEIVMWYPATRATRKRTLTFADYFALAPELQSEARGDTAAVRQSLSIAINSEPEGVAPELLDQILAAPLFGSKNARPAGGRFPLVVWSARHGTAAAQCVLSEYLASHGYVVAFVRFAGAPMPPPYQAKDTAEKRATLAQHVRDLQAAVTRLTHQPQVAAQRMAVLAWSYGGEAALRLQQQEARIKLVVSLSATPLTNWVYQGREALAALDAKTLRAAYVLLTERVAANGTVYTPPPLLHELPAGGAFIVFPALAHGNFNALEGLIPSLMGITKVQAWSKSGPAAQSGYETAARLALFFLNQQLKQHRPMPVADWLRSQQLPVDFVTATQFDKRSAPIP